MFDHLTDMFSPRQQQISNNSTPSPGKEVARVTPGRVRKKVDARRQIEDKTPHSRLEQETFDMRDPRLLAVEDKELVYFPVDVELDKLKDWEAAIVNGDNEVKSETKGALVTVNNTQVAIFRYGDSVLATSARCPHAGGPLHLGDIEVLPDRSLCVRCPWHRWAFCVGREGALSGQIGRTRRTLFGRRKGEGECVFPPGRGEEGEGVKVFPALVDTRRRKVKIGFESFDTKTLVEEQF
eukprot:GFUD01023608.1.p1 GENE.GFUD01023608.1~~GFUD01023608.1.p1  ORF type:complete len:238 (+),score=87.57 GFUD01023608.1:65-778(+)